MVLKILLGIVLFLLLLSILIFAFFFTAKDRAIIFQKEKNITVEGVPRSYYALHTGKVPNKIIIGLHGLGDTPKRFAYYSALHNSTDDKTLTLYPQATGPTKPGQRRGWNSGFCCGSGWINDANDVEFIESLIKQYSEKYKILPENIFITGFSNGAFMALRFATEKPEAIGGIAVSAGTIGTTKNTLQPKSPMPIMLMHGTADKTVLFNGGASIENPDFDWLAFSETKKVWEQVNKNIAPVEAIRYDNMGHQWPGWRLFNFWNKTTEGSKKAVNFFNKLAQP